MTKKRKRKPTKRTIQHSNLIPIKPDNNIFLGQSNIDITYWNARSIKNKTICIYDYLAAKSCDVFLLTETWLSSTTDIGDPNQAVLATALPAGFQIQHTPRNNGLKGGGVGMVFSEEVSVKFNIQLPKCNQFEIMQTAIYAGCARIIIVIVYRPQPNKKNGLKLKLFWPQWIKILTSLVAMKDEFIIIGDLNFHLDNITNRSTNKFLNILPEFGLHQHVQESTHVHGHILDVVITRTDSKVVTALQVVDLGFTNDTDDLIRDHLAIKMVIKANKRSIPNKTIQYRNWKNVNKDNFERDLTEHIREATTEYEPDILAQ